MYLVKYSKNNEDRFCVFYKGKPIIFGVKNICKLLPFGYDEDFFNDLPYGRYELLLSFEEEI